MRREREVMPRRCVRSARAGVDFYYWRAVASVEDFREVPMPELPEVEAARVLVQEQCGGQRIQGVHAEERGGGPRTGQFDDIIFDDPGGSAEHVSQALTGKSLVQVKRRGKQLLLMLSSPPHLLAHFGMTGSFTVRGVEPLKYQKFKVDDAAWPPRFTKFEIVFEQAALAFTDPRRLGRLRLRSDPLNEEPWRSLAADPLLDTIERSQWTETIWSKGCAIKALLLDQAALVSGVGNWGARPITPPPVLARAARACDARSLAGPPTPRSGG